MAEYRTVLREGEHAEAAEMFEEAVRLTEDTRLRYLASFLSGRYFQSRGDVAEAERHYSNAGAIIPRAWSSRMALANLRYQSGQPPSDEEVFSLVDPQPRNDDPWISYPYGSYARWPELIARLRVTLESGER
jgi:tetratricopeptide (TPR) repeat protein